MFSFWIIRKTASHRFLSPAQFCQAIRLSRNCGLLAEVATALLTGLRRAELRALRWEDIDFARRQLLVRRGKGGKSRTVPLNRRARAALRWQRRRTGWSRFVFPGWTHSNRRDPADRPRGIDWWREALDPIRNAMPVFRALPGCSTGRAWHLLRHTFASRLAQRGVSLYKIAEWMGHADVTTTKIYAHLKELYDADIEKV